MCIFCKIIAGEIPSYKVYEDDSVLAFLDINPINAGHTLVVPKKHFSNLSEINEAQLSGLILNVKKVAALLMKKLNFTDYTLSENNGPLAGQSVAHIHFHIIPRFADDKLPSWGHKAYEAGEAEEIIKKILA